MARKDLLVNGAGNENNGKVGFEYANDNFIELYNTDATLSGQIENLNTIKENKQWMPNDWKAENDKSSAYPTGVTYFVINSPWYNGRIGNNAVIKTTKYNDFVTKQEAFRSSEISEGAIFIRQVHITDNLPWGAWEKIVTDKRPDFALLTLQSGWAGGIYYGKNQSNQLILASNSLLNGTTAWGTIIATLPEGYRPLYNTPIDFYSTDGRVISGFVLLSDGKINIHDPAVANLPTTSGQMILTVNAIINLY